MEIEPTLVSRPNVLESGARVEVSIKGVTTQVHIASSSCAGDLGLADEVSFSAPKYIMSLCCYLAVSCCSLREFVN